MYTHFEDRNTSFSLHETRLVWMTPPVEVPKPLADRIIESLDDPAEKLKMLMKEFEGKGEDEQANVLQTVSDHLRTFDARPDVQMVILENLRNLEEQANALKTKVDLSTFQKSLEQLRNRVAKGEITKGATASAGEGGREKVSEKFGDKVNRFSVAVTETVLKDEWTKDWSPEKKRNVGLALTGGTVAAVALGAWLFARARKAKRLGQEVAKQSSGGILKKVGITLGVGLLAFLGIKGYELYQKYDSVQDAIQDVRKQGEEYLKRGQEMLNDKQGKLGRAKDKLFGNEKDEMSDEEKKIQQAEAESAKVLNVYLAKGLLLRHAGAKEGLIENDYHEASVSAMIGNSYVRQISLYTLARARMKKDVVALYKQNPSLQELKSDAEIRALLFLARALNGELSRRETHELLERTGERVENMSVGKFLDTVSLLPSFVAKFTEVLNGKSFRDMDVGKFVRESFGSHEALTQFVSHPTISQRLIQLDSRLSDRRVLAAVGFYAFAPGQHGDDNLARLADPAHPKIEGKHADIFLDVCRKIHASITDPKTVQYLIQYAQGDPEREKSVREHLLGKVDGSTVGDLNVKDAVQLYMFLQFARTDPIESVQSSYPATVRESSATGALLLQMKLLQIVSNINGTMGMDLRNKLALDAVSYGATPNLPPETIGVIRNAGGMVFAAGCDALVGWAKRVGEEGWSLWKEAHKQEGLIQVGAVATDVFVPAGIAAIWYKFVTRDMARVMANRLGGKGFLANIKKIVPWWLHPTRAGNLAADPAWMSDVADEILRHKDTIGVMRKHNETMGRRMEEIYERFNRRGYQPASLKQFYQEMAALKKSGADAEVVKEVVKGVRQWELTGKTPAMQLHRFSLPRRQWRNWRLQYAQGGKLRQATPPSLLRYAGGVGVSGVFVGLDSMALRETQTRIQKTLEGLEAGLTMAGFTHSYGKEGSLYSHPCGAKVELKKLEERISSLSHANWERLSVDSAALATTVLLPSMVLVPGIGWTMAGAVIVAHSGIEAMEQSQHRDFLLHTPTPVLALLGYGNAIGVDEHDMVEELSNGQLADWLRDKNEVEKRKILQKTFIVMFYQQLMRLAQTHPGLVEEILDGRDMPDFLRDEGDFSRDFNDIIKPFLSLRLFQLSRDSGVSWEEFRNLRIDEGWFDMRNIDPEGMRKALSDSASFYLEHVREKRYYEALKKNDEERKRMQTEFTPETGSVEELLHVADREIFEEESNKHIVALGEKEVRGKKVSSMQRPENSRYETVTEAGIHEVIDALERQYPHARRGQVPSSFFYTDTTPKVTYVPSQDQLSGDTESALARGAFAYLPRGEVPQGMDERIDAMCAHADTVVSMQPVSPAVRTMLNIPGDTAAYISIDDKGRFQSGEIPERLRKAFGFSLQQPERGGNPLGTSDILLFHYIVPGEGAHVMTMTTLRCGGYDVSKWSVNTERIALNADTGNTAVTDHFQRTVERGTPFVQWEEKHASLLRRRVDGKEEGTLVKQELQKRRTQAKAMATSIERRVLSLQEKTYKQSHSFIAVEKGQYGMGYGGGALLYKHVTPLSIGPLKQRSTTRGPEGFARIEFRSDPRKPVKPIELYKIQGYHTLQTYTGEERKIIWDALTTPIEGDLEGSLLKVLNLSTYEISKPIIPMFELFGKKMRNFKTELFDKLVPLYMRAVDKRQFLEFLVLELREKKSIDEKCVESIPRSIQNAMEKVRKSVA